jgi:hypothetical protein
MTEPTPQAVEAAARAMYERSPDPEHTWEHLERGVRVEYVRDVEAAIPHIEADLRARIAEEMGR